MAVDRNDFAVDLEFIQLAVQPLQICRASDGRENCDVCTDAGIFGNVSVETGGRLDLKNLHADSGPRPREVAHEDSHSGWIGEI